MKEVALGSAEIFDSVGEERVPENERELGGTHRNMLLKVLDQHP